MAPGTPGPSSWAWPPGTGVPGPRPAPRAVCPRRERPLACAPGSGRVGCLEGRGVPSPPLASVPALWPLVTMAGSIGGGWALPTGTSPASQRAVTGVCARLLPASRRPRAPCPGAWVSSQCLCAACRLPGAPRPLPAWHPALSRQPCSAPGPGSPALGPGPPDCAQPLGSGPVLPAPPPGGLCPARQHSCRCPRHPVLAGALAPCLRRVLGSRSTV